MRGRIASVTVTAADVESYLICATPRSGSTLLCGLLESSGVAGRPASYFNRKTLDRYAGAWGVSRARDGRIDHAFVQAAMTAGSTPNGVFAARVMGETWPELIGDLAAAAPDAIRTDAELLEAEFGRLRYVHLRRDDVVAQAVSWVKSLQTHYWHPGEEREPGGQPPRYDRELIGRLVTAVEEYEAAWRHWFAAHGIQPYEVTYEQLATDPLGTAGRVLEQLGLTVPDGRQLQIRDQRQADQINREWISRYHA